MQTDVNNIQVRYFTIRDRTDRTPVARSLSWPDFVTMLGELSQKNERLDKDGEAVIPGYFDRPDAQMLRSRMTADASKRYAAALSDRIADMRDEDGEPEDDSPIDIASSEIVDADIAMMGNVIQNHFLAKDNRLYGEVEQSLDRLAASLAATLSDYPEEVEPVYREALSQVDPKFVGYRNDDNIDFISFVVLDIDVPGGAEIAESRLGALGCEWVKVSTHSYGQKTPYKFRFYLPLEAPIPADRWPQTFDALKATIGKMDPACRNLSRIYYLPSRPPLGKNPNGDIDPPWIFEHHRGVPISHDKIMAMGREHGMREAPTPRAVPDRARTAADQAEQIFHYAGKRGGPLSMAEQDAGRFLLSSYRRRHHDALADLRNTDSRHGFALSVTYREVSDCARRGIPMDPFSLVRFIAWACSQGADSELRLSSRPASSGNTLDELRDMIDSACTKRGIPMSPDMAADLDDAISDAYANESPDGNYSSPDHPWRDWVVGKKPGELPYPLDYEAFDQRHKKVVFRLFDGGLQPRDFFVTLLHAVSATEYARQRPSFPAPAVAEFVYRKTIEYYCASNRKFLERLMRENDAGTIGSALEPLAKKMHEYLTGEGPDGSGAGKVSYRNTRLFRRAMANVFGRDCEHFVKVMASASRACVQKSLLDTWPMMADSGVAGMLPVLESSIIGGSSPDAKKNSSWILTLPFTVPDSAILPASLRRERE